MNQVKTGKLIAKLRRAQGMTQEMLGEQLGVTNKTVSRWENGTYMPDIDKLLTLSDVLHISVNELLCGECAADAAAFTACAEENIKEVLQKSTVYSLKERIAYFRGKWLREHVLLLVFSIVGFCAAVFYAVWIAKTVLWIWGVFVGGCLLYIYLRNQMMIYVEHHAFDGTSDRGAVGR
ncbi:MAG: helix-turn-helix transcriptional regulator [Clostridia bacterium]|nr:helix-turn-helix transcriptional regulator [Clostridia bacterium]